MREIGNMASGGVIQGPLRPLSSAFLTGAIRISLAAVAANRKSGIRIRAKSPELNTIQISNRKFSTVSRTILQAIPLIACSPTQLVLIYGGAIKTPCNILRISNRR